jgi:hypothetical protein
MDLAQHRLNSPADQHHPAQLTPGVHERTGNEKHITTGIFHKPGKFVPKFIDTPI